jgi:hypothetical protein
MNPELRNRLQTFLMPLYQDVDGISRLEEVERIARIARTLYQPPSEDEARALELLLLFQRLGNWLDRVGNVSRTVLAIGSGLTEAELRRTAMSIRRLDVPESTIERAVAAAVVIDRAGLRGLAQRFASSRREGQTILDVIREALAETWIPDWVPESGRAWLERRHEAKRQYCARILDELALND